MIARSPDERARMAAFLAELWPEGPPAGSELRVSTFKPGFASWGFRSIEELADAWPQLQSDRPGRDLYLACAAVRPGLEPGKRGGTDDARAIPGLWLDLDTSDGEHDEKALPSKREALEFVDGLPLRPTLVLDSGGGLYAWWLFEGGPVAFDDDAERKRFARLSEGWQAFVRHQAAARGWMLDDTADLARVLRPAGAWNFKYRPALLVELVRSDGPRWNPSDFEVWGIEPSAPSSVTSMVELPRDVPAWMARAVGQLGIPTREVRECGRLRAIKFRACPACGGVSSKGRPLDAWTAFLRPISGRLSCWRASCDANGGWTPDKRPNGLAPREWLRRYLPEHAGELDALRRLERTEAVGAMVRLLPADAPRVQLADAPAALEKLLAEATFWARESRGIADIVTAPGVGKTLAALEQARRDPRFAFLGANHRLLVEKMDELGAPAFRFQGVGEACRLREPVELARDSIGLEGWRRSACPDCAHGRNGDQSCEAWEPIPPDLPLFAPHAAVPVLSKRKRGRPSALDGRLVVFDELPPLVEELAFTEPELEVAARPRALVRRVRVKGRWIERDDFIEPIVRSVELLRRIGREVVRLADGDWREVEGGDLLELARALDLDLERAEADLVLLDPIGHRIFRYPRGAELRAGAWSTERFARLEVAALFPALVAVLQGRSGVEHGRLRVVADPEERVSVKLTRPSPLADGGAGAIVLAAEGELLAEAVRAANPGREVRIYGLDVEPAEGSVRRVWQYHRGASRRQVLTGRKMNDRGRGALLRSLEKLRSLSREDFGDASVAAGVVTFKGLADALRGALREREEGTPRSALALGLAALPGLDLTPDRVLHFGRDERGSNALERAGAVLVLGAPRRNLGATWAEARAVGVDEQAHADRWTAADLEQAVGRARLIRGGSKVVLVVGDHPPPSWAGRCERTLPVAHRAASAEREAVVDEALAFFERHGFLAAWGCARSA